MISWHQKVRLLEEENQFLRTKIEELEKRLLAYENPHTPPSKSKKRPPRKEATGTLGAPKGHPRWTRNDPEPTGSVEYTEEKCPDCDAKLDDPIRIESILQEEIPEPQPIEVIEHRICHYLCPKCRKHIVARNNAPADRFGKNVLAHVTLLKFDDRLPLQKVVSSIERHYSFPITDVGVMNITRKVSKRLFLPYQELIKRIRKAKAIYVDETEIKVDGKTYHLWTFVSDTEVVFVIRKSRGKDVLEEILGPSYKGVICCDGWTAYSNYSTNLQRCWAHLLREAKHFAEQHESFQGFYDSLKSIFSKIKGMREKPPNRIKRAALKMELELGLRQQITQMTSYREFRKFANKIQNGFNYWFTCVTHLFVEPTNNTAERALRELIVQRKIIGGLRRENGAKTMETISSMIATWKKRELPIFQTLKSFL